jgi:hypothetical protein
LKIDSRKRGKKRSKPARHVEENDGTHRALVRHRYSVRPSFKMSSWIYVREGHLAQAGRVSALTIRHLKKSEIDALCTHPNFELAAEYVDRMPEYMVD